MTGVVRSVAGADLFTVQTPKGDVVTVQLSGVQGPRLGTATRADEPFAWDAREFLRKKIIGQQVALTVLAQAGDKHYADVRLGDEDLVETMVNNGWCTVRAGAKGARAAELAELEARARADHVGVFQTDRSRAVRVPAALKPLRLYETYAGQAGGVAAVVDGVRGGTTLRVVFLPSFVAGTVAVAGVQAPAVRWLPEQRRHEELAPCGLAALRFVEDHVQHRDVHIELRSVDMNDTFVGVVRLLGRDLGAELVKMGLARVVPGAGVPEDSDYYRTLLAHQDAAVARKAGMWKTLPAPTSSSSSSAAASASATGGANGSEAGKGGASKKKETADRFTGKVVDIPSSGVLVVERADGSTQRLMLASVRAPRVTRESSRTPLPRDAQYRNQLAAQGRELLRQRIFDRPVRCERRYERTEAAAPAAAGAGASSEPAVYWDVYAGNSKNVALELLEAGLLEVVRHRATDPRSSDYDRMCLAEKRAQERGVGVHARLETVQLRRVSDLTQDMKQSTALELLPHLKTPMAGVVDHVFSATRVKVFVPAQSSLLAFVCAGVQAPHATDKDARMAALAEEGLRALRRRVHMRAVTVTAIDSADRGGNFVATLECGGESLAAFLVERGLAWVSPAAAARRPVLAAQLAELEARARAAKRGVWAFYEPAPADDDEQQEQDGKGKGKDKPAKEFFDAVVTDFGEYPSFYLRRAADTAALDAMADALAAAAAGEDAGAAQRDMYLHTVPKRGELVLAQYSDGSWCRAACLGAAPDGRLRVRYVDYGTEEPCARARVRPLPAALAAPPPMARRARLAFVRPPRSDDACAADFGDYLRELTDGRTLTATVEYTADGVPCVSLAADTVHVNAAVVRQGLATVAVPRGAAAPSDAALAALREAQDKARAQRLNLWRYGDIADDDDDDENSADNGRSRRRRR